MEHKAPHRFKTISAFHAMRGLPAPRHPLISVINFEESFHTPEDGQHSLIFDFYSIAVKKGMNSKYRYGQNEYDFDEGVMFFMAPNQVFGIDVQGHQPPRGWMLLIHPDFLWNTSLAKTIKKYEFFDYAVNEALFLSQEEEMTVIQIIQNIRKEYSANIDNFTQDIIISQIETLLNYSDRFYQRMFITRKKAHHHILESLEKILDDYFDKQDLIIKGLPTVQYLSGELHISESYLRNLLKQLTGLSTQQHIHAKLIEKAKEKLSASDLSVSEVAYALGFGHAQSFSRLFKAKTDMSPLEFRQSFN